MTLEQWQAKLAGLQANLKTVEDLVKEVEGQIDVFYRETVGMAPGDRATIEGTVKMIDRVLRMAHEQETTGKDVSCLPQDE